MLVAAALIPLMFPNNGHGIHYDYAVGGIWRSGDLVAPYDFAIQKSQNEIDREIAEAKSKIILYYHYDNQAHAKAVERLSGVARRHPASSMHQMRKTIDSIYMVGYLQMPDSMPDFGSHRLILLDGNIGSELSASQYITPLDIQDTLLRDSILVPDIAYDANRTQLELDSRLSQLGTTSQMVKQGELIISEGQRVSLEQAQVISSLERENDKHFQANYHPTGRYLGLFGLCIISFVALFFFLQNTRHPLLEDDRKVLFVLVTILLMSAVTAAVVHTNPEWVLVVPLCIVPVMMRVFFDMRVALYVQITTIIILANVVPNSYEFIFYQLIAGMMSIVAVRNLESRSKFFLVSIAIFATYSLIYTFGVLSQESTLAGITLDRYLVFFLNALLTLLAYPLIYLFEKIFGLTTNLTLLELSSTDTPALRELSRNAPGTFQHSIQVSNISEDLINEIGGNAILAKVGALYHDIGKIRAPLFFTENQNSGFNPHDELDYRESASIIIRHVTDGLDLAKKYHLPNEVQQFIRTHHGTTFTGYFYAKYKEAHPGETIDKGDFRYNGPTPFSRETAVVMIVDSVEAACRSMKEHDKDSIDKKVDQIIDDKISGNQFRNCNLTFGDIDRIRKILKTKMMSIYHARIAYPVTK
jgi:hypothetical protein